MRARAEPGGALALFQTLAREARGSADLDPTALQNRVDLISQGVMVGYNFTAACNAARKTPPDVERFWKVIEHALPPFLVNREERAARSDLGRRR